jgi:hypothetical protein
MAVKSAIGRAGGSARQGGQRHSVKAIRNARGRVWKNELLNAPLQQKNGEKEPQDEKRGCLLSSSPRLCWPVHPSQLIRDGSIGTHRVGNAVG